METAYAEGLKEGWERAVREYNTPKLPITEKYENSRCPQCRRYFDEYETIEDSVVWRAVTLERCPWCGQKLKWE